MAEKEDNFQEGATKFACLLSKLFCVAKVVKHSIVLLGLMLEQLKVMSRMQNNNKKVKLSDDTQKTIIWWSDFLEY